MKVKDKVKSRLSLWSGDIGEVVAIHPVWDFENSDKQIDTYVHVVFPETDKHYAYRQSFYSKDLIVVESVSHTCT